MVRTENETDPEPIGAGEFICKIGKVSFLSPAKTVPPTALIP